MEKAYVPFICEKNLGNLQRLPCLAIISTMKSTPQIILEIILNILPLKLGFYIGSNWRQIPILGTTRF